ncbi:hypothetical protein NCAS_0A13780 [Naumovozyma castellii]|uniref:Uncharacterized protein n=1 Tax=Naumovozyma castellii TaxID=27288 RepID=G0V8Y7_NAUCA|nr:hypothetical protein NCAS_0A13780 [Naumovozyma castellii CBS 4309]CCC67936.1 hypothetical protein NCAS_0A13780 [Naumovozyma castellii CBS 4309]
MMKRKSTEEISSHLVTPEEPSTIKDKTRPGNESTELEKIGGESSSTVTKDDDSVTKDPFLSSLRSTTELENSIVSLVQRLKDSTDKEIVENEEIIEVLEKALTSISHWTLQSQLLQLQQKNSDRSAVEVSLAKKEVEFLAKRKNSQRSDASEKESVKRFKIKQYSNDKFVNSKDGGESPQKKSKIGTSAQKKPHPNTLPMTTSEQPETRESPPTAGSLKLVENNKVHPRMRRTSDNPSTNEYIRVFHLQKSLGNEKS